MLSVSRELLKKYDRPGPRYTSYPPATQFHEGVGAAEYRKELAAVGEDDPLSIYVHVPFCKSRCTYCGCYVIPTPKRSISRQYLDYCLKELQMARELLPGKTRVVAVHLGGGTPTYLTPEEIGELLSRIRELYDFTDDVEIAVELDPRITTQEHLDVLLRCGTNRVSLGVQDTSDEVQEAIGRFQGRDQTVRFFRLCREKGFDSINVDLVYGLPRQTRERFQKTVQDTLELHPERFAIFGYAHVPWIKPHQKRIDPAELPEAEARLELYLLAHDQLTGAGYRHIGMDHFALPDDELSRAQEKGCLGRNFMGYTPGRSSKIIGAGISSIGDLGTGYFQNDKKLASYYRSLDAGEFPLEKGFLVNQDDVIRRYVVHEILCNLKVDYSAFEDRFGVKFGEYFPVEMGDALDLEKDGLVQLDAKGLRVTPLGVLFVRNIAMPFDRYLREKPPARATYSRTV